MLYLLKAIYYVYDWNTDLTTFQSAHAKPISIAWHHYGCLLGQLHQATFMIFMGFALLYMYHKQSRLCDQDPEKASVRVSHVVK